VGSTQGLTPFSVSTISDVGSCISPPFALQSFSSHWSSFAVNRKSSFTESSITIASTGGITLSSSGNIQVSPGATSGNASVISLTPIYGFTGTVNLSCVVNSMINPANDQPGCSLSSTALNITGTATVTSTLAVSTTAATTAARMHRPFLLEGLTALLSMVFWFIPGRRNARLRMLVIALALAVLKVRSAVVAEAEGRKRRAVVTREQPQGPTP
jgi:hypothetical protein